MRKIATRLIILMPLLLVGCGRDLEQARKYSDMKLECDSLIAQSILVLKEQKAKVDSLRKIRDGVLAAETQKYKLSEIERKITNIVEIESNIKNVIKHLESIKTFSENGKKATERIIYIKRKYMIYATVIQVHDENIMIKEITNGLTAKQYISRYLPKESK
jgi:hypothetical protein